MDVLKRKGRLALVLAVLLVGLAACGGGGDSSSDDDDDGDGDGGTATVSFATDIQPVFTANCTITTCHGGLNPQAGMSLESGSAYNNLVNVAAGYTTDATYRVIPFDAAGSALYQRVSGVGLAAGELTMPQGGGSISTSEIDSIETWINEGALNN